MDINSFALGYSAGKKKGGGTPEGFHMVRFFNDDRTTLLYTVFVPDGSSAMYAGETPVSTEDASWELTGFEPSPANVTADMDCYAVYTNIRVLASASWERIAELSANGEAQNYYAIGDTKMIHVEGTVGTLEVNGDYGVFILGFDHNEEIEGNGITFGTFKDANGKDICLVDSKYDTKNTDGTICFNVNHWGEFNYGGWAGCDLRYDILGSTDNAPSNYGRTIDTTRTGYEPSVNCTTNPVANTLMAALPAELRAVMKRIVKYTDNKCGSGDTADKVTLMTDYLPLLAEFEIMGARKNANSAEQNYQAQYAYYAAGNAKIKYQHSSNDSAAAWFLRSLIVNNPMCSFVNAKGSSSGNYVSLALGIAPIFKV